jgi:rubrerythrin
MSTDSVRELFTDALKQEEYVLELYISILGRTKDKKMRNVIERIREDEGVHIGNVRRILGLIK